MTTLPLCRMAKTPHPVIVGEQPYVATLWRGRFLRRGCGEVGILGVQ